MFLGDVFEYADYIVRPILYLLSLFRSARPLLPSPDNRILRLSATALAERIRSKRLTSEEVVSTFIERCQCVNASINAIIDERFEEALRDARRVDAALRNDEENVSTLKKTKPLLGLPITIKENCKVKGMKFTNCVRRHKNRRATSHGPAVRRLIEAGAIPIAVTSTSPYCLYPETINNVIGTTFNPHDRSRSIGGSSGGEAALLASSASVIGLATDAGGSIPIPCSFASLYGHTSTMDKLTFYETSQDVEASYTVGPMCRYVEDVELVLNVLCQRDLTSQISQVNMTRLKIFYLEQLDEKAFPSSQIMRRRIRDAARYLGEVHGCQVEQFPINKLSNIFQLYKMNYNQKMYLAIQKLCQRVDNQRLLNRIFVKLCYFAPKLFELQTSESGYKQFQMEKDALTQMMQEILSDTGVLLLPSYPQSTFYLHEALFKSSKCFYANFPTFLNLSSTTIPAGFDDQRMPIGLQVIAAARRDPLSISVAKHLEKVFGGWQPPPYDR